MGDQLAFPLGPEPAPSTERATLAPLPAKPYTPPKLVKRPPTLAEIMFRPRSFAERVADATGMPLKVAQNAEQILDLFRCLTAAAAEEEMGTEAWMRASWEELVHHIGFEHAVQYARYEARDTASGALESFVDSWLEARAVQ